jgi:hypothetical protein
MNNLNLCPKQRQISTEELSELLIIELSSEAEIGFSFGV